MSKQTLTRQTAMTATLLLGFGLAVGLLLLLGAGTGSVMAAPPASNPHAPALNATAGITVVKIAPATIYQALGAGQTLVPYTLTIQNPSNYTIASGAVVTDALPAGTTLLGGTTGPDWAGVFPMGSTAVTYTLQMDKSDASIEAGGYQASLAVPVRDGSVVVNSDYCFSGTVNSTVRTFCEGVPVTTVVRAPDFSLVEHPSAPVCAGGRVTYTISVSNPGGVRTSDNFTITGGITPVLNMLPGTISDGGTWTPYTIMWNVATILQANGSNQVTRTFAVTIPASTAHGTFLTNTYVVTSPEVLPNTSLWQSSGVTVTRLTAAFTSTAPACQNNQVAFQNNSLGATSYQWNFGDSSPVSTQVNPTHVYAGDGTYTVILTATGACGTAVTATTVTVYPLPTPVLQIAPDPTQLGVTTYFTDAGALGAAWDWSFGDGTTASTGASSTNHIYTGTPGIFTVILTSTAATGCYSTTSRSLQVDPGAPYTVSLTALPSQTPVGTSSAINATVTDQWGNAVSDGTTITFTAGPPPAVIAPPTDPTSGGVANSAVTSTLAGPVTVQGTAPNGVFGTTVVTFTPGAPYTVTLVAAPLSLPVGNGAALTATVVDVYNNPIPGQAITFTHSGGLGSGTLAPQIDAADGLGQAHATVTSTLPGPKTITAAASASVWDTAVVTFTAGAPYTITLVADPLTPTVGNSAALTATVTDQFANLISGETITFTTADDLGLGNITPATDSTDAAGEAHSSVSSTSAGPKTIAATASNLVSGTVVVDFQAGPPDSVALAAVPDTQTVGLTSQLRARVWDQYLNVVPGEVVTFTYSGALGLGSLSPITDATNSFGWAYADIMSTLPGPKLVTATTSNLVDDTTVVTFVVGAPYSLTLDALPTTLQVGNTSTLTATLTDQYANPLSGYTITLATTDPLGLGALTPLSGATDVAGQITSALSSTIPGVKVITATQDGLTATAQVTFAVGDPFTVTLVGVPDTLPVGQNAVLTATVTDRFGNPISGDGVLFSASSLGSGGIDPGWGLTDGAGQVFSTISSTLAGPHLIEARELNNNVTGTTTITWTPGGPANLSLVADPTSLPVGSTSNLTATLTDQYSNPLSGYAVNFNTPDPLGSGGLAPTSDTTDAAGEATSAISSTLTGIKTITATTSGLTATVQVTFNVGALATIVVTPNPVTVTVGATQPFTATGYDAYSNPVAIAPTWTTNGGTVSPGPSATTVFTAQTTPASGRLVTATQGITSGTAVVNIVHGSAIGIDLTPAAATIAAGDSQAYTVTARDSYNNTWDVTASSALAITPGAGGTWTNNTYTSEISGTWTVTATYLALSDTAALTVTHAPTAASAALSPNPHTVGAGGQVIYTLVATDTYGNAWDATASGTYTITPAAGGSWLANVYTSQYTGTWTVTGTVPNAVATAVLTVTELVASFTRDPAGAVCVGATIQFTDTSSGGPTSWLWDFGDSTTSPLQHPTHAYASAGTFTVTLTVSNTYGSDVATGTVDVVSAPSVGIVRAPAGSVCVGASVSFTATNSGGPASYLWSFGDGITATGQYVSHAYTTSGVHTVWLTATNGCGTDVASTSITVNAPPTASFVRDPAGNVTIGAMVQFTDTSTGGPTSWLWDFGDSTTSPLQHPTHAYAITGTLTVTLTASNACGSDDATGTVTVVTGCVGASITNLISNSPVDYGQTMYFTATVAGTSPVTYTWDFGDSTPQTTGVGLATTNHTYGSVGTFTVTLTVTNACGTDTGTLLVTVNCVPVGGADFTWDPVSPATTQTVTFTGTVGAGSPPVSYAWDWGDGTPGATGNPAFHTFTVSGTYTVLMTATNGCGLVTATHTLTATGAAVTPVYGVELAPPTAAQSGAPGGTVIYALILTNTGNVADSFDLTVAVAGEQWPTTVVPTRTTSLPTGGTAAVTVSVSISATATNGQQSIATVTATSVATTTATDSSVLTTTAVTTCTPPVVTNLISDSPVDQGQTMHFTATVTGDAPITFIWDFGDATPPAAGVGLATTSHVYASSGVYTVTLAVTNACGSDSGSLVVTVNTGIRYIYLPVVWRNYTPPPRPPLTLIASPVALVVGDTSVLTATALDSGGAPVAGMPVGFSTFDPLGSGALTPYGAVTDGNGQVTATLRSTVVGLVRVTAYADNGGFDSIGLYFRATSFCAPQLMAVADTGPVPREVALDTAGHRAFVAHEGGITVINTETFAVLAEIQYLTFAHGITYDPDHSRIWVTTRAAGIGRVRVLDGTSYAIIADLPADVLPHSVAYNPTNGRMYVTNYGSGTVGIYNAANMTLEQTLTGFAEPSHIGVNPVTNKIYVVNHQAVNHVEVIDGATHAHHRIVTDLIDPFGIAVDTTRNLVYVTAIAHARMSIIDGATDAQLAYVDIQRSGGQPVPLRVVAVNPNVGPEGHLLIVTSSADGGQDQLLLIPNGWPTLGTPVPMNVPIYPLVGITLDSGRDRVWMTGQDSNLVSVAQDGEPVCTTPFSLGEREEEEFQIEVFTTR